MPKPRFFNFKRKSSGPSQNGNQSHRRTGEPEKSQVTISQFFGRAEKSKHFDGSGDVEETAAGTSLSSQERKTVEVTYPFGKRQLSDEDGATSDIVPTPKRAKTESAANNSARKSHLAAASTSHANDPESFDEEPGTSQSKGIIKVAKKELTAATKEKLQAFTSSSVSELCGPDATCGAPANDDLDAIDSSHRQGAGVHTQDVCHIDVTDSDLSTATLKSPSNFERFKAKNSGASKYANKGKVGAALDSDSGPPRNMKIKYTPLEQQFLDIKAKYPDVLLFVECGYKYRFFGEDAEIAGKELNIYAHVDHNFMTGSIPTHRLFVHVRRLVSNGYKVGVVKQTETAALKAAGDNRAGPFTRQLTGLYTKATLIGEDVDPVFQGGASGSGCGESGGSYLFCLYEVPAEGKQNKTQTLAVVAVQPSTGDLLYDVFEDTAQRPELETRISLLQPAELLLPGTLTPATETLIREVVAVSSQAEDRIRTERIDDGVFQCEAAIHSLTEFYWDAEHSEDNANMSFVLKLPKPVISCLNGLLTYLKEFNLHNILKVTSNFQELSHKSLYMKLNARTVQNLELFRNLTDGKERGSLIWVLDHTRTRFGSRLLRRWLARPLQDSGEIERRLESVSEILADGSSALSNALQALHKLPDLERGLTTIYHKKCSTLEFLSTCKAFGRVCREFKLLSDAGREPPQSPLLREISREVPGLLSDVGDWTAALDDKAAKDGDKTKLFVNEADFPALTRRKQAIEGVLGELRDHRRHVRLTLGTPALEYVTVSGVEFMVEVRNTQIRKVPADWIKISSTKAVSRFHTPFVVDACKRLNQEKESLVIDANKAWIQFLQSFEACYPRYKRAVQYLAQLDCLYSMAQLARQYGYCRWVDSLYSMAQLARQYGYCRPEIVSDGHVIDVEEGRHPVVETLLQGDRQFVPNDTHLDAATARCMVVTGPNMGGKSSYIKQVALLAIMAQIGSYVPATRARLSVLDGIYTRMGASDELFKGRSTFMVELQEASDVITQSTSRSLVVMDELGRGTSTHDGVAIAMATLKYFVEEVRCLTIFVTHYPLLAELETLHPDHVTNHHMAFLVHEEDEDAHADACEAVTFLYQLVRGQAARSYGLNVARLADIPPAILRNATARSRHLENVVCRRREQRELFRLLCCSQAGSDVISAIQQLQNASTTDDEENISTQ